MLIITADDYGKTKHATDSILKCFSNKRITSTSAMLFMEDSERAASLASNSDLEVGLHLNFTESFSAKNTPSKLRDQQKKVLSYLTKNKLAQIVYNPFLAESFRSLYLAQHEEFVRLYGKHPDFINGHHHMHLCTNILASNLMPKKARIRRTFSFVSGEKSFFNLFYRRILDWWVDKKFISTNRFYSIVPFKNHERLKQIISLAEKESIEIEVHPENKEEIEFLLSDQCKRFFDSVHCGCLQHLPN